MLAAAGLGWYFLGEHTVRNENNTVANLGTSHETPQGKPSHLDESSLREVGSLDKESIKSSLGTSSEKAVLPEKNFDFLANYCLNCHDAEKEEGEVNLEDLDFHITTIEQAELWQSVLNAINSGEMPPEDKKQPKSQEKADFLESLSNTMVDARKVLSDSGGKITMSRLNKREYQNSLDALLGVKLDEKFLPADGGSNDFDTVGASLFLSSSKLEEYLKSGRKALDEFYLKRAARNVKPFVYRVEPEILIKKARENSQKAKKDAKKPQHYGGGKYGQHYARLPHNDKGAYLMLTTGNVLIHLNPKKEMPPGTYTLRVAGGVTAESPSYRHFIELGHPEEGKNIKSQLDGFPIKSLHITGRPGQPNVTETQIRVGMDTRRDFVIRERQPTAWGHLRKILNKEQNRNGYGHEPSIWIDWIEIEGPIVQNQAKSPLDQILDLHHEKSTGDQFKRARNIIKDFAIKALRENQPSAQFVDALLEIFKRQLKIDKDFDVAIRKPLSIILASPGFIYLNEPGREGNPRGLSDRELAVRLSYFLWSSPPDDRLISLANKRELRNPKVLRQEVERMIKDPKAHHFAAGLVHQWLDMERLDLFQFNGQTFREFDENTREASREEVYQSFLYLLRSSEQGQVHNLLKSDYVVVNAMMASYYGLEGVKGDHYRKVSLANNSPRGGLLGMAAIHVMGSDGRESNPVERGAWVLRHILNDPPPPAPANVPQISRLDDKVLTKRQRLVAHQEEPQCASCHRKIDPIGFGMENFDASGKWRGSYTTATMDKATRKKNKGFKPKKVDASGALYKGPAFADFFELRDRISERKEDFSQGFIEALIEYGLRRPYAFTDDELTSQIMASAKRQDYQLVDFIHGIVQSKQFQSK
ncbi:hypothetical protein LNTAR_06979 [Lentisphaera araneosa HTCC2155]|uniref:Cytochrome c domain-containing protein n=2 Tax=Lentisphaera TaxID=256846 RepID=A6DMT1_9BACT|nr:hypothetical protein LNTAR_06979 [Lentisphaera araneosa HTCC2155]